MHVRFATPTASGIPCKAYLDAMEKTVGILEDVGWKVSLDLVKHDVYVQRARNSLVANFLRSEATHLFFIDDDMIWEPEHAAHLLASPRSVTFGAYRLKQDEEDYPVLIDTDPETHQPMGHKGWISAAGAPTGFLCIHRAVLETLIKSYPESEYDDLERDGSAIGKAWDLFPQGVRDRRWWGEDFAFCNLWRDIGGMMWLWPNMRLGHVDRRTGKTYWGNYHEYLKAPRAEAA